MHLWQEDERSDAVFFLLFVSCQITVPQMICVIAKDIHFDHLIVLLARFPHCEVIILLFIMNRYFVERILEII